MRDQWNSKLGFLIAAIGSAVGLGNLWRFPYTAAQNGGGAFLLPYLIAIITAGIPILILEYTIGKTCRSGAPVALSRLNKKFEFLGWAQVMVAFVIITYYFAIVVWTLSYLGFSFTQQWGSDPAAFFTGKYLGATANAHQLGGIRTNLIIPFIIVWLLSALILYRGISKGIEKACKICLPILLILMLLLVIRGLSLPGAVDGLEYMFKPDWKALISPSVWIAAYGQIFFSLSIGFAIMISYSSYLPEKTDIVNSAFITATANHGFELFAGIGVFSIVGYMASQQGIPVDQIASLSGVGLAFITFPTAISALPALNTIFGLCFFGALFTAGITSLISIVQAVISGMQDKFAMSKNKAITIVLIPAFIISILFITGAGINILDIIDSYINKIGIVGCGLIEVLLISWFFDPETLRKEANKFSNFSIGKWWTYALKIVTVLVLGIMLILNTIDLIKNGYPPYSRLDTNLFGWGSIVVVLAGTWIMTSLRGYFGYNEIPRVSHKEVK